MSISVSDTYMTTATTMSMPNLEDFGYFDTILKRKKAESHWLEINLVAAPAYNICERIFAITYYIDIDLMS